MARRTLLLDIALALALAGASLALGASFFFGTGLDFKQQQQMLGESEAWQHAVVVWWILGAFCAGGIAVHHRWPVLGLALATIGVGGHLLNAGGDLRALGIKLLPVESMPLDLALPLALYALTAGHRWRWLARVATVTLSAGAYASAVFAQVAMRQELAIEKPDVLAPSLGGMLYDALSGESGLVLLIVLAFAAGNAMRSRRERLAALEQRAADLERERDQRAALATAAERGRITRELHDIVAHGLSVMVVQAQGAAAALERHPERSAAALREVVGSGRDALAEMRRMLGVARAPDGQSERAPLPGVGALPALVDQVRAAGTPVRLHIEGQPVPLPAGLDLCVYRIVQEALTNTLKHAGAGAKATVRLGFAARWLELSVTDDGTGPVSTVDDSGGNGLRGIAERVALFSGSVEAGAATPAGFRLRVVLPLSPVESGLSVGSLPLVAGTAARPNPGGSAARPTPAGTAAAQPTPAAT
jgi:signal transduction histidine kinase